MFGHFEKMGDFASLNFLQFVLGTLTRYSPDEEPVVLSAMEDFLYDISTSIVEQMTGGIRDFERDREDWHEDIMSGSPWKTKLNCKLEVTSGVSQGVGPTASDADASAFAAPPGNAEPAGSRGHDERLGTVPDHVRPQRVRETRIGYSALARGMQIVIACSLC